ncbi:MAG: UDP-2,3-diacylglucosamine diphosphatase [Candidatus Coatesbacteria bacterium]|nr:UDP-2,3-diacylglucosamine diphosphatase [Candidatus Coatesbacteria bacterium]
MSLIAISDLHLGPDDDDLKAAFVELLDFVTPEVDSLVINGDLFSFWFGYPDVIPYRYLTVLAKMLELSDRGVNFRYFHGNHDFAMGPFFETYLPAAIYSDFALIDYQGTNVHFEHGDLINYEDTGYKLLRKVVRSKPINWLFKAVPPHIGLGIANCCAHISRKYVIGKNTSFYYCCLESAYRRMRDGADLVVYGHGHRTIFREMVICRKKKLLVMIPGIKRSEIYFLRLSGENSGLFAFDPEIRQERVVHSFDLNSLGKAVEG